MSGSRNGSWATLALALVLALSLGVLATLQYRWIDEVSRGEQQRLRASLTAAAERFGEDFDRELARAFHYFLLRPPSAEGVEERLVERYRLWLAGAPYPELVADLWLAERDDDGGPPRLRRLDAASGRFVEVAWPAGLAPVRGWLAAPPPGWLGGPPGEPEPRGGDREGGTSGVGGISGMGGPRGMGGWGGLGEGSRQLLLGDPPALVVPAPRGPLVVVGLDRKFLTATLPAELTERHFAGGDGLEYDVAMVTQAEPPQALFRSDPSLPLDRYLPGDVRVDLFGLRWFQDLAIGPGLAPGLDGSPFGPPPADRGARGLHHRRPGLGPGPGFAAGPLDRPRWRLVVSHREGSLEAAVARARRHNLAVSLGVLALLAGSVGVLAVSARRAERLARQQLEFVAGVTHELHTPLAAICAAGENLADGVVADADQVRRYGATIRDAGRRLAGQVAQALELAGMQSGRESYRFAPVAVDGVVDAALEDCRWEIEERGIEVERDLPAGLPPVAGNGAALRRCCATCSATPSSTAVPGAGRRRRGRPGTG